MMMQFTTLFAAACSAAFSAFIQVPFVSQDAVRQAVSAVESSAGGSMTQGTLIIVDYSRPSQTRRLAVMRLATGKIEQYARVTHGKNSGAILPAAFSNQEGSLQSSAGLFKISETFSGKHGLSLRLAGLEPGKNDMALRRGIIIHAAPYAAARSMLLNWRSGFRLGRSEGCFALADDDFSTLNRLLERPAYLYAYAGKQARRPGRLLRRKNASAPSLCPVQKRGGVL